MAQLASTKWCISTRDCLWKGNHTEKNRHSEKCTPVRGVRGIARCLFHFTRTHVGTHTVQGVFLGPPDRSLGPPHNSTPLSRICKMSEVLDSATPKYGGYCVLHVNLVRRAHFSSWATR